MENNMENIENRPEACNLIKKETLVQLFSCEFCEISKNTFSQNTSGRLLLKRIRLKLRGS